jgi:hypothetical protein
VILASKGIARMTRVVVTGGSGKADRTVVRDLLERVMWASIETVFPDVPLRAMGLTRRQVAGRVVLEYVFLTLFGAVAGAISDCCGAARSEVRTLSSEPHYLCGNG